MFLFIYYLFVILGKQQTKDLRIKGGGITCVDNRHWLKPEGPCFCSQNKAFSLKTLCEYCLFFLRKATKLSVTLEFLLKCDVHLNK